MFLLFISSILCVQVELIYMYIEVIPQFFAATKSINRWGLKKRKFTKLSCLWFRLDRNTLFI